MINCEEISQVMRDNVKDKIKQMNKHVGLAIIMVGDNEASKKYVAGKLKDCAAVGIDAQLTHIEYIEGIDDPKVIELLLISIIDNYNANDNIDGVIVQLPLPKGVDESTVLSAIALEKDVDGFLPNSKFVPCTPKGVLTILDELHVNLKGKNVVLVGYGKLVNKPLMPILSDNGATITICRSKTPPEQLKMFCQNADIIITATGRRSLITSDYVNKNTIVIDCGITVIEGKQFGDCDELVYGVCDKVTPRIKGMGLMTRASLLENVLLATTQKKPE